LPMLMTDFWKTSAQPDDTRCLPPTKTTTRFLL
jgi:hypothetical protein